MPGCQSRRGDHSTLVSYAVERLLYRLGESAYRDQLVLKGAQLFRIWMGELHRPTRDLDLLGSGSPDLEVVVAMIREVASHPVADGITFDESTIAASRIREDADYEGVRVTLSAHLAGARIPLQVDIGFGDAVTPAAALTEYPALLGTLPPRILTYPAETVVAEKYHAMVVLDIQNSRMKDFYDIWFLARSRSFEPNALAAAIRATFERRQTARSAFPPFALTAGFLANPEKAATVGGLLEPVGTERPRTGVTRRSRSSDPQAFGRVLEIAECLRVREGNTLPSRPQIGLGAVRLTGRGVRNIAILLTVWSGSQQQ